MGQREVQAAMKHQADMATSTRVVLVAMCADHKDGEPFALSINDMVEKSRCGRRTVVRSIQELRDCGVLSTTSNGRGLVCVLNVGR